MLLVLLTMRPLVACAPKASLMAFVSARSPRPVLVAWAFKYCTSSAFTRPCFMAICMARAGPLPSGEGALRWWASALVP